MYVLISSIPLHSAKYKTVHIFDSFFYKLNTRCSYSVLKVNILCSVFTAQCSINRYLLRILVKYFNIQLLCTLLTIQTNCYIFGSIELDIEPKAIGRNDHIEHQTYLLRQSMKHEFSMIRLKFVLISGANDQSFFEDNALKMKFF